jgi:hypothetical protein
MCSWDRKPDDKDERHQSNTTEETSCPGPFSKIPETLTAGNCQQAEEKETGSPQSILDYHPEHGGSFV